MATTLKLARKVRLQWRRTWTETWKDDLGTVDIGDFTDGINNKVGSLIISSTSSSASMREAQSKTLTCPLQVGDFVRIIAGSPTLAAPGSGGPPNKDGEGTPGSVVWTGYVAAKDVDSDGKEIDADKGIDYWIDRVRFTCAGLGGLFAGIDLHRYWGQAGAGPFMLSGSLPFSPNREHNHGEITARDVLRYGTATKRWTALSALSALLDWHLYTVDSAGVKTARFPNWPEFKLGAADDELADRIGCLRLGNVVKALDWEVRDVQAGGTLLDAMVALLHPRRGLSFSFQVQSQTSDSADKKPIIIAVHSLLSEAKTIVIPSSEGGGSVVIPPSSAQRTVDTQASHRRASFSGDTGPRRLTMLGQRCVCVMGLRWKPDDSGPLVRGWAAADDASTETDIEHSDVFRLFRINPAWDGSISNGTATVGNLARSGAVSGPNDAIFGTGGLTGVRVVGSGAFPAGNVTLTDTLPIPSRAKDNGGTGTSYGLEAWLADPTDKALDYSAPRIRPMAFVHIPSSNTWTELAVSITVTGPASVQLGDSWRDRARIRSALSATGAELVVVLGVIEPVPFAVSYEPPAGTAVLSDRARRLRWAEYVWIAQDTPLAVKVDKTVVKPASDVVARDDSALLVQALAMARPLGERSASCTLIDRGEILSRAPTIADDLPSPGMLLTAVKYGPNSPDESPIGYIVTSRTRSAERGRYGTTITCELPDINMEAIL